jgi:uncharacterized protein (TIGR01777 family)
MNVLVTGGTGLVGRALVKELLARGHQVTILSRNPEKHRQAVPGASLAAWDGRSSQGWGDLVEEADAVINLAGASIAGENIFAIFGQRWNDAYKQRVRRSREEGGRALTEAIQAAARKPRLLLQASAVGYYGPRGAESVDEATPSGHDFMAEVCRAWETSTQQVTTLGVRHVVIRSGLVMSREGGILPMMLLPFRMFVGGPLAGGQQVVSWIHIRDQVEAICFLVESETAEGVYNLTAPIPVTNAQFAKIAGKVLRRPAFFPVPSFALKMLLGEKATLVIEGQRVLPNRLIAEGYQFHFSELEEALRDLR